MACSYIWEKLKFLAAFKGFFRTPCFYYGVISLILLSLVYFSVSRLPRAMALQGVGALTAIETSSLSLSAADNSKDGVLFYNQSQSFLLEPPELKLIQNDSLAAFSTPRVLSTRVLGSIFGQGPQIRKEIIEYMVQQGDTFQSIADTFDISLNTVLTANELTKSSKIKVGQTLVILPVSGLLHFVKSGDALSSIAKVYQANVEEIIEANELADESDVYIGDILVVPNGIMPKKAPINSQTYLADSFFKFPVEGRITQTLHWYNGVDIANKCGTSIFAAASGTVLKAKYGWNGGGGNIVTILHKDGVVSWYGHLGTILVKAGDKVELGDRVGLMGGLPGTAGAGVSTGCHVHFTVIGAKNPFGTLSLGYQMKFVK